VRQVRGAFIPDSLAPLFEPYVRKTLGPALARYGLERKLGEDEAIAARIRDTLAGILWVIPKDRQVAITVAPGTAIDVQLSACQPAG
jgi:hypothetical protein